jgi:diguanylate cyclase (GGDEF)-like protein
LSGRPVEAAQLAKLRDGEAVSEAYPLMRRALDLLPDGVLIIGSNREVLYLNAAFERLWRIPPQVVCQGDGAMLTHVLEQLDDPSAFMELVERLYHSPDPSEDELTFSDGRVFHRRSVALQAGGGGFGRIWIFSDVTEAWSARIDSLTGLLNRRAYARELPDFMAAAPGDVVKGFALLDVDHFKPYNDLYGHAAGDAALECLGGLLRAQLTESSDKVYRIGGEEFAVASMHCSTTTAVHFHEKILECVQNARIAHAENGPYHVVTVSMGVGLFRGKADPREVFGEVDLALYRAKKLGRNKISVVNLDRTDQQARRSPLAPFSISRGGRHANSG